MRRGEDCSTHAEPDTKKTWGNLKKKPSDQRRGKRERGHARKRAKNKCPPPATLRRQHKGS